MNPLIEIVTAFIFLCILLGAATIYSRLHWMIKATLISLTLVFGWMFYCGFISLMGYPVADSAPPTFRYISSMVREPTLSDHGAIFLWYVDGNNPLPRAVVLPYSKSARDQMAEAKKRSMLGAVYMTLGNSGHSGHSGNGGTGTGEHSDRETSERAGGGASGRAGNGTGSNASGSGDYDFIEPPDTLPKKQKDFK